MGVATLLGDAGRLEEGLEFMNRAVESGSNDPNVYNNLGAYLLRLGGKTRVSSVSVFVSEARQTSLAGIRWESYHFSTPQIELGKPLLLTRELLPWTPSTL